LKLSRIFLPNDTCYVESIKSPKIILGTNTKSMNLRIHELVIFNQTTKIDTHEEKYFHSRWIDKIGWWRRSDHTKPFVSHDRFNYWYKEATEGFLLVKLKSSLRKFYGRHHDLVDRYGISVSQMTTDMFHLS